jgi:SPP1 family predicted phage head-tail adaptor
MIDPGQMRFRVTLERPITTIQNELGETVLSDANGFEAVQDVWAAIRPLTSAENLRARSVGLDTTHMIELWYFAGLDSTWRLRRDTVDGTTYFNIKGQKDPDLLKREWNLECVVSANG